MKQSPSSEVNSHSASQEIPPPFTEPKIYRRVHKNPSLECILSQMNSLHIHTPYSFKMNFNIILPSVPRCPKACPSFWYSD